MLRQIEKLRKQPKAVRNQYAFGIALTATLLIVAVWSISLPARLSTVGDIHAPKELTENEDLSNQFNQLKNVLSEGIEQIKTQAELIEAETATSTLVGTTSVPEATSSAPLGV